VRYFCRTEGRGKEERKGKVGGWCRKEGQRKGKEREVGDEGEKVGEGMCRPQQKLCKSRIARNIVVHYRRHQNQVLNKYVILPCPLMS